MPKDRTDRIGFGSVNDSDSFTYSLILKKLF